MKLLIIVMLFTQAAIFLVTCFKVLFARSAGPRPLLPALAITLVIVASGSWQIARMHSDELGADVLAYFSPLLLGMGLMAAFLAIRQRRGLDDGP